MDEYGVSFAAIRCGNGAPGISASCQYTRLYRNVADAGAWARPTARGGDISRPAICRPFRRTEFNRDGISAEGDQRMTAAVREGDALAAIVARAPQRRFVGLN